MPRPLCLAAPSLSCRALFSGCSESGSPRIGGGGGHPRKPTTINDTDITETEREAQSRLLAGRSADGARPEPAPTPPPTDAPQNPYYAAPPPYVFAHPPSLLERWKAKGGILGGLASALLLLAKIGAPVLALLAKLKFLLVALKLLTFGKFLLGGGSMLLSMWVWARFYGWPFGVGIVLLIFIHECGHALAARMRGIPTGIMVFIPLMGAFVTTKRYGKNIVEDAFIGIMGPVFGTLAGLGCLVIYALTPSHSPFWLVLAQMNFFMNLFNLAPTPPLDGGWITPLFSPKLLAVGAVLLLFLIPLNPFIGILALMSLPRIISGWKAKPEDSPYYQATASDRWRFGAAYLGLAAFLALLGFGLHARILALHLVA